MSLSDSPAIRRFGCLTLLVLVTAGPAGCGATSGGGAAETIPTGPGQAVIPKQELQNLGATEQSLARPSRKAR
jgi:hypothetical protein